MFQKIIFDQLLKKLDSIHTGALTMTTPEGKTYSFEGENEGPIASIQILDWSCISQWVTKGDIAL